MQWLGLFAVAILVLLSLCGVLYDRRRRRDWPKLDSRQALSVIIPCYNDQDSLAQTVSQLFACWPSEQLQVVIINDASTDDSWSCMQRLQQHYPISLVALTDNIGKAAAVNLGIRKHTVHDLILCLDADSCINRPALHDLLLRMQSQPRLGACSSAYRPTNGGFLAAMQALEYNMVRLSQGAANLCSGLSLWGGCLLFRRQAIEQTPGFRSGAITEDTDFAYLLNRAGWRVEQSYFAIDSQVPSTWKQWLSQKVRWSAGGFQCVLSYPDVWLKNPVQVLLILAYSAILVSGLGGFFSHESLWDMLELGLSLWQKNFTFGNIWRLLYLQFGSSLWSFGLSLALVVANCLVYALPLAKARKNRLLLFMIVPFLLGYLPLYLLIALVGLAVLIKRLPRLQANERGW